MRTAPADPAHARFVALLAGILVCLALPTPRAGAQDGAALSPAPREEVELRVVKVGPGGRTRAGDWAGVLVEFRDSALAPREILLRLTGRDRDGDPPSYERVVVGDPERARAAWIYGKLPFHAGAGRLTITAHEALEDASPELGGELGFRAGRVLGRVWIEPDRLIAPESGLLGVIGASDFALRQYGVTLQPNERWLPLGHEHTEVVTGLTIDDIPDRWQGLAPYETLVWGRGPDADPGSLGPDRARSVMEWVRRGGHLVVVLPPVGQEWTVAARNPLAPVLPRVRIERREGVPLDPYRALLTLDTGAPLPSSSVVHAFTPLAEADRLEAMRVLDGPDGACVVARRLVGAGMVTLVGLDLASGALVSAGVLHAEAFWHRVLGRRHPLDSFEQVRARDSDLAAAIQQRAISDYDADIENEINRTGDASAGVLLSLVVFSAYWLLAGPVGFAIIKRNGWRAHAWVGFLAMIGLFTAIAWAGATALRPKRIEGTHLVFLDEIHGTGVQRARAWMSVLVPEYGEATIAVGGSQSDDLIAPWEPAGAGAGVGFPDNRPYRIAARRPSAMRVPVRSTIKQIRADWAGEGLWRMPEPVREPGSEGPASLRLGDAANGLVIGELVHNLPGPLTDVLVVVITGQREVAQGGRGPTWMPAISYMDTPSQPAWAPGERLDLRRVTGNVERTPIERSSLNWFSDRALIGVGRGFTAEGVVRSADPASRFTALSFMQMLGAPDFRAFRSRGRASPLAARRETHGLDLSRWFTQPCVIIIGHLEQASGDSPVPITVDQQPVRSRGRTVVRWVYPLEPAPPRWADPTHRLERGG